MNYVLKESVVRSMVRRLFEMEGHEESIVKVNDVVDQLASLTDPGNPDYKPNTRAELQVTLKTLVDDLPEEKISQIYDKIKHAIETQEDTGEEQMTRANNKLKSVEETVRRAVRNIIKSEILNEASKEDKAKKLWASMPAPVGPLPPVQKIPPGVHGGEHSDRFQRNVKGLQGTFKKMNIEDYESEAERDGAPGRKNMMVSDVGGSSFKEIAHELGFAAESGAKQAVEKALAKMRTRIAMDPDELEIAVLTAMNDYIEELGSTGELTPEDVQLLKSHPDIIRELDGFREFLGGELKKAERAGK